ncbi:MAG: hypothetical protein Q8M29_19290 [Bacteroidota bacterium]|nr:hypothetical protein [Bacteroidota bacterium]
MPQSYSIRPAQPSEFEALGKLMVLVYSQLEGFPKPDEQPAYYNMLTNIGDFTTKPQTELLVAVSEDNQLLGGVVYFSDMQYYGSGGTAYRSAGCLEEQSSGICRNSGFVIPFTYNF